MFCSYLITEEFVIRCRANLLDWCHVIDHSMVSISYSLLDCVECKSFFVIIIWCFTMAVGGRQMLDNEPPFRSRRQPNQVSA